VGHDPDATKPGKGRRGEGARRLGLVVVTATGSSQKAGVSRPFAFRCSLIQDDEFTAQIDNAQNAGG
jgi:hypothetical protein